jgi:hypothetical protein
MVGSQYWLTINKKEIMAGLPPIVNEKDKRKGLISAIVFLLLIFIYLKLVSFTMADPPPRDTPMQASLQIEQVVLKEFKIEGGGSGTPSDDTFDPKPKPQTEKVATKTESKTEIQSGESNKTTDKNSQNSATSNTPAPNPFGTGGSGGGKDLGKGTGFGSDTGDGIGSGSGEGVKPRIRLRDPSVVDISTNQSCVVRLKVTINAEGKVVRADNIKAITTTTDQRIINQVISAVLEQVEYNKKTGAPLEQAFITVELQAR